MKIVNGIMAQLPYTPPRTQLCIVELEDVCVTTGSGQPVPDTPIQIKNGAVGVDEFTDVTEHGEKDSFDFGTKDF